MRRYRLHRKGGRALREHNRHNVVANVSLSFELLSIVLVERHERAYMEHDLVAAGERRVHRHLPGQIALVVQTAPKFVLPEQLDAVTHCRQKFFKRRRSRLIAKHIALVGLALLAVEYAKLVSLACLAVFHHQQLFREILGRLDVPELPPRPRQLWASMLKYFCRRERLFLLHRNYHPLIAGLPPHNDAVLKRGLASSGVTHSVCVAVDFVDDREGKRALLLHETNKVAVVSSQEEVPVPAHLKLCILQHSRTAQRRPLGPVLNAKPIHRRKQLRLGLHGGLHSACRLHHFVIAVVASVAVMCIPRIVIILAGLAFDAAGEEDACGGSRGRITWHKADAVVKVVCAPPVPPEGSQDCAEGHVTGAEPAPLVAPLVVGAAAVGERPQHARVHVAGHTESSLCKALGRYVLALWCCAAAGGAVASGVDALEPLPHLVFGVCTHIIYTPGILGAAQGEAVGTRRPLYGWFCRHDLLQVDRSQGCTAVARVCLVRIVEHGVPMQHKPAPLPVLDGAALLDEIALARRNRDARHPSRRHGCHQPLAQSSKRNAVGTVWDRAKRQLPLLVGYHLQHCSHVLCVDT
eukprot:Opistho-2@56325